MEPYKDDQCLIKVIETKKEMEEALSLYARIAVKKNPLIIDLKITESFYYENYCKFWLDFLLAEGISVAAFDLKTNKLICTALSMDLFSTPPSELQIENLHPLMQREEAICLKALEEYMSEGVIQNRKNYYFYELMAATDEKYAFSKLYYKVSMYRIALMLKKGFKSYYGELTTPNGIRAWLEKIKPTHVKRICFEDFEYKGKRVFGNVDWKGMGFQEEKPYCYFVVKEFNMKDLNDFRAKL